MKTRPKVCEEMNKRNVDPSLALFGVFLIAPVFISKSLLFPTKLLPQAHRKKKIEF